MNATTPDRRTVVCMMAKVPVPGAVKTRLCPPLRPAQAAELARAFLLDTWAVVQGLGDAVPILSYAGDPELLPEPLDRVERWPQAGGDLGERIQDVVERGLALGDRVVVIGSDAPALPGALIDRARAMLDAHDAVLGPAADGGYYLIAMRRIEDGLLGGLPWSGDDTLLATYRRLRRRGYSVRLLPTWFDVDDAESLALLDAALSSGALRAPATAAVLARLR